MERKKKMEKRRGSYGNVEMLKRNWREVREGRGKEREEEGIFRRSRKVLRSPERRMGIEMGRVEEIMRRWKRKMEEIMGGIKDIKGWKEDMEQMMRKIKESTEEIKEQGRRAREEIEELRREVRELKAQEVKWKEEREELRKCVKEMESKMEKVVRGVEDWWEEDRKEGKRGIMEMERRVKEIERKMERKEREDRRRNIIIRGVEIMKGGTREAVEEIIRAVGIKVEGMEIRRLGGREKGRETVWVRLENEEQKREVMNRKRELKGREERILEDWTWKERKMRWK